MDYYPDTSSLTNGPIWANVAPFQPARREATGPLVAKASQTVAAGAPNFFGDVHGPSAATAKPTERKVTDRTESATTFLAERKSADPQLPNFSANEIEIIAKQRVRLMAAKYAGGEQVTEVIARLEILNRRLLDRSPRITVERVQSLETAVANLLQVSQAREERLRRLGIEV
jgi:hypothetical protein